MEVILKEDIENVGLAFDLVNVKAGYGRNFLIPQGKAILATPSQKANLEVLLKEQAAEQAALIKAANDTVEQLKKTSIKIIAKTGSGDKLFGSINNANLVEELEKQGVTIDRKYIKIPGNSIKRTGAYTAKIRLHREVEYDYNFEIIAEEKPKEKKAKDEPKKFIPKEEESSFPEDNPFDIPKL